MIASQRLWQAFAGVVTTLLIATHLDPILQGWYYTFVGVAALYSVFEMGLSTAVLQMTAHKFIRLSWSVSGADGDDVAGFGSFVSKSVRVYLVTAGLFFLVVYPFGIYLFSERELTLTHPLEWQLPWAALVLLTSLGLLALPFLAIVEGSGAITESYMVRLAQGVFGAFACWLLLWCGAGLWATTMMGLAVLCVVLIWLNTRRLNLWFLVKRHWSSDHFDWKKELWPLQWRLGLSWISVFFWAQLATPIVFFYQGPIAAGQMGLSLTMANMVGILAQSWIARSVPLMSQAVALQDWEGLHDIFLHDLKIALTAFCTGGIVVLGFWLLLSNTTYIERVLPGEGFLALFLFVFFYLVNGAMATQLRSFKKEPLLRIFFLGAVLSVLGSWWAAQVSVSAVAYVMALVQLIVVFPLTYRTWKIKIREWQPKHQI